MNDLKEQAKIIIAKGKSLNDPELVRMGLEMLDAYSASAMPTEAAPPVKTASSSTRLDMSQFTMSSKGSNNIIDKSGKKQSIYIGPRENKYQDDGEHKDILTPKVEPTERTRKSVEQQKVTQTCEVCGKIEKVLPLYVREFYRCESCLLKGKA
jgi:hypothetical protein